MDPEKRQRLEVAGWVTGSTSEFLQLTPEETELVEIRLLLSARIKQLRQDKELTQAQLAQLMGSSPSQVSKLETGDPSVSMDLLLRGLFALGDSRRELGLVLSGQAESS